MQHGEEREANLRQKINELKAALTAQQSKKLNVNLLERAGNRICQYSKECEQCREYIPLLTERIDAIQGMSDSLDPQQLIEFRHSMKDISEHLRKKHKLVGEGFYMSLCISLGMSMGTAFGVLFNNLAMGLSLGLCIGVAIGVSLDADAKKKGLVL